MAPGLSAWSCARFRGFMPLALHQLSSSLAFSGGNVAQSAGASFEKANDFVEALRKAMSEAQDIELLFAIWEQNVETVRALNKCLRQEALPGSGIAAQLVAHLKHCASALVKPGNANDTSQDPKSEVTRRSQNQSLRSNIDKSALTISEPKRIRRGHATFLRHPLGRPLG